VGSTTSKTHPHLLLNIQWSQGYDLVLQPVSQQALKDISSKIDESNILTTKQREHLAIAKDDMDFHIQCFLAGVQFFDQTVEAPKSYSKAMKSPKSEG
jgi:hypothetical protein